MKATIVLIADNDAENYGRKLMLEANRHEKMGGKLTCYKFGVFRGLRTFCR